MTNVFELLKKEGYDTDLIWKRIKKLTKKLMESYYPFIYHLNKL